MGERPRSGSPQQVACYRCVLEGAEPAVPQVYVMVGGYSYCVDHVRRGEQQRQAAAQAERDRGPW